MSIRSVFLSGENSTAINLHFIPLVTQEKIPHCVLAGARKQCGDETKSRILGIIELYWVSLSPTFLPIPKFPGYWGYPGYISLYWVTLSPTVLHIPQSWEYPGHISDPCVNLGNCVDMSCSQNPLQTKSLEAPLSDASLLSYFIFWSKN